MDNERNADTVTLLKRQLAESAAQAQELAQREQELSLLRARLQELEGLSGQLRERDERDSKRSVAPLLPADDAIIIDSSASDASTIFEKAREIVEKRRAGNY